MAGPSDTSTDGLTTTLRRAYATMGFGGRRTVLELFGQTDDAHADVPRDSADASPPSDKDVSGGESVGDSDRARRAVWQVVDLVGGGRYSSRTVAADDLFGGIPPHWEVTRVEPTDLKRHRDVVVVTGRIFCRPPGSWEVTALPFAHIWTFLQGRVVKVRSYLEGIELRRIERLPAG